MYMYSIHVHTCIDVHVVLELTLCTYDEHMYINVQYCINVHVHVHILMYTLCIQVHIHVY